jgi:hypothetical protein
MAVSGGAVWVSLHNAAQLRCYRAASREQLADINITPMVTKMLHGLALLPFTYSFQYSFQSLF